MMKRFCASLLALLLALCALPWAGATDVPAQEVTILFTHDLHSHFLPQADGGASRLTTPYSTGTSKRFKFRKMCFMVRCPLSCTARPSARR